MFMGHKNIGEIMRTTGVRRQIRQIAGESNSSTMLRMIAGKWRLKRIKDIAGIRLQVIRGTARVRPNSKISQMIAGEIRTDAMHRWSAEVLLFLNSEHLTTPWARGHRG
jgi:hypothetical protein